MNVQLVPSQCSTSVFSAPTLTSVPTAHASHGDGTATAKRELYEELGFAGGYPRPAHAGGRGGDVRTGPGQPGRRDQRDRKPDPPSQLIDGHHEHSSIGHVRGPAQREPVGPHAPRRRATAFFGTAA